MDSVMIQTFFGLIVTIIFSIFAYQALGFLRWELLTKRQAERPILVLRVFIAVLLGQSMGSFLMSMITILQNLVVHN